MKKNKPQSGKQRFTREIIYIIVCGFFGAFFTHFFPHADLSTLCHNIPVSDLQAPAIAMGLKGVHAITKLI